MNGTWELLIAGGVAIGCLLGVLLTVLTFPGIWFMVLAAALAQWWSYEQLPGAGIAGAAPDPASPAVAQSLMFNWWVLGTAAALALLGEIIEFFASALGAAKAGGTRRGAIGSILGGLIGAIAGTMILPILGTILGAALGAGVGALLFERHAGRKTWKEATKVGAGAAAGRLVATIAKAAIACAVALMLTLDAFI
ncbi:MAG TPA: DUF456 domain-containing protein [Phycisphaerales bacterium]|nr:DUF456 domain-containing protein [Phycisphaerales bacterium]